MEKSRKSLPLEFLAARRKAIMEKAVERRRLVARVQIAKGRPAASPLPSFQKAVAPPPPQ